MSKKNTGQIFVAKETFVTEIDGSMVSVHADVTRVREGHQLLSGREHMFRPIDVHFDVEQATDVPGQKRGA